MAIMTVALEPGDLAPDFLLPNLEGKLARFYDRFSGNAVVLYFCASNGGAEGEMELRGLAERRDQFDAAEGRVVVVTQDSHEANAAFISRLGLDLDLFSDPVGAITNGYCGAPAEAWPGDGNRASIFVLDPNQRIAAAFHGGTQHAQRALDGLMDLRRRLAPGPDPRPAPILVLPNVLDPELCQQLIGEWEREHFEGVITIGTGFQDDADSLVLAETVKKRRDHRLADDVNARISEIIGRRVVPMLQKAFHFRLGSMQHFRVVAYSAERGDFFQTHRDNDSPSTENRDFAMSVNLNDDYDGGAVRFPEFSDELYRPPLGGAAIFSCSLLHEAMPVSRGTRFVALSFLFGPREIKRQPSVRLPGLGG
jgi:peroxiredoxin/predicted 2-oxoglutarate/Fe(II)-dependent dioxygenase YbiX